ncbi:ABC transporter permease [Fimbriiglobus ruber]|uniref:ABC transporter permease n=1 Tax=Fimbriiglobus ruber TaxID=1908690 RepID=UPI000B4B4AC7|nr:ABC transporter permease [Fimbriiglobus ruber]
MNLHGLLIAPTGERQPLAVSAAVIRLGRDPECEICVDAALYSNVSSVHARIDQSAAGFLLTHLSKSNKTLLNGSPLSGLTPIKAGDKIRLGYTGPTVQILLVAVLMVMVFGRLPDIDNPIERGQKTVSLLFLLAVSSFWLGCNNSAKELVKERIIFLRERDFNLRVDSYYLSKFVVMVGIGLLQILLLLGIVRVACDPAGSLLGQKLILSLLAVTGTTVGLFISSAPRTEEIATALVPVAVLPQIVLAGVIAPLSSAPKFVAKVFITSYSGQRSLESLLPAADVAFLKREDAIVVGALSFVLGHVVIFSALTYYLLLRGSSK